MTSRSTERPEGSLYRLTILLLLGALIGSSLVSQTGLTTAQEPDEEEHVPPPSQQSQASNPERMIFSEDFEAYGDSSRWSEDHPFTVQQELVTSGSFAARLTSTGGLPMFGQRRLRDNFNRVFVRLDFHVVSIGPQPVTLLHLRPARTQSVIAFKIEPSGHISYVSGATGITSQSQVTVTPGEWHQVQIFIDTMQQEDNVRIWLDDLELTTMRQDVWLGEGAVSLVEIGDNTTGVTSDIAVDNVMVDDEFIDANRAPDPVSGILRVQTIPARQGIQFELDGKIFKTDSTGIARIRVDEWSTDLRRRIIVHDADYGTSRLSFTGWRDWLSPHSRDVFAAFALWEPIEISFTDMNGQSVDSATIDSLVIKSSTGEIYTLDGEDLGDPVMLISRVITTPSGVSVKPITYIVDQVLIDGANVVNRAQQRTTFETDTTWTISVLTYQVRFEAIDALFGSPIGQEIAVQAPDGSVQRLALDDEGAVYIPRIPRGDYTVSVIGGGYSPPRPIRISRDQVIQMEVISHVDAALAIGAASFVAFGLVIAGRPFLVTAPVRFIMSRRPVASHFLGRRAGL
jgi:hypothetical protein